MSDEEKERNKDLDQMVCMGEERKESNFAGFLFRGVGCCDLRSWSGFVHERETEGIRECDGIGGSTCELTIGLYLSR